MTTPDKRTGPAPITKINIEGFEHEFTFHRFEWESYVNGGYEIRALVADPYHTILQDLAIDIILRKARREPIVIQFQIGWSDGRFTNIRTAFVTSIQGDGIHNSGFIELVAIDPPSWYLNAGSADGRHYKGRVSSVIRQVVADFAPNVELDITETQDNPEGDWWMMRMDPQTFIRSLLDWSASLTPQKTNWFVLSNDNTLLIKEQAEIDGIDLGIFQVNTVVGGKDVMEWELVSDNFLSVLQTKLYTQGKSIISGEYCDKISQPEKTKIDDQRTSSKSNSANLSRDRSFDKPDSLDRATSIISVPEFNDGMLGINYHDYIDGRARGMFLDALGGVMSLRIRVSGNIKLDDNTVLGVSTCNLSWQDNRNNKNYFLSGRWLIYGYHHMVSRDTFYTDIYLYRLDHNADAIER